MDVRLRPGLSRSQQAYCMERLRLLIELLLAGHPNASLALLFQVEVWPFAKVTQEYLEQHPHDLGAYAELLYRWLEGLECRIELIPD